MTLVHNSLALAVLALAVGCSDPMAPQNGQKIWPDDFRGTYLDPQFQKVYQGRGDGGGGGGGGGSGACDLTKHNSGDCPTKLGQALVGTGIYISNCAVQNWRACVGGAYPTSGLWQQWENGQDAYGHTGQEDWATGRDPNWPGNGNGYACTFGCPDNDPPFNPIPGGGY